MSHATLLAQLMPPVSYQHGPRLRAEQQAEGTQLDRAQGHAQRAKNAVTPYGAAELISEWERVCGLHPASTATYQERLQAVLAKLAETGGLSIPYFIRVAQGLGYKINILELQPFRASINHASDQLWAPGILWVWQVQVQGSARRLYRFQAGQSAASERLCAFSDPVIETVFQDLKPAHTFVYFAYQE